MSLMRSSRPVGMPEYTVVTEKHEAGPGTWEVLTVTVLRDGEPVGSYKRNYPELFSTFFPFRGKDGKDYALYSDHYTRTRIMRLPECEDIGGEESSPSGFCPTGYYVPLTRKGVYKSAIDGETDTLQYMQQEAVNAEEGENVELGPLEFCDFGFISGCVWGDDGSWKIQYLDLSKAHEGVVVRSAKFGYIDMPENLTLEQVIDLSEYEEGEWERVKIACMKRFSLRGDA